MSIFHDQEFWVLVGFLIFFGLLGRTFWTLMRGGLDGRADKIRAQLDAANSLRAEAETLLASYAAKQAQAVKDAAAILAEAEAEAERMRVEGEAELKRSLAVREAQAMERIALAERDAIQSVRARAVEIAVRAAADLVPQAIDAAGAASLIDRAIAELPNQTGG